MILAGVTGLMQPVMAQEISKPRTLEGGQVHINFAAPLVRNRITCNYAHVSDFRREYTIAFTKFERRLRRIGDCTKFRNSTSVKISVRCLSSTDGIAQIQKSSGLEDYDRMALALVKNAAPIETSTLSEGNELVIDLDYPLVRCEVFKLQNQAVLSYPPGLYYAKQTTPQHYSLRAIDRFRR